MTVVRRIVDDGDPDWVKWVEEDPVQGYKGFGQDPRPGSREDNRTAIIGKVLSALQTNQTYLGRTNPSTAQNTAQVQALTRQMTALIRIAVDQLDSQAGT